MQFMTMNLIWLLVWNLQILMSLKKHGESERRIDMEGKLACK